MRFENLHYIVLRIGPFANMGGYCCGGFSAKELHLYQDCTYLTADQVDL